jgi:integrase
VKNWLKRLPLARSYKCKIRNTLSALFSHARLYKFYSVENPIAEVKQSGKRMVEPGVLTKTQLEQLLSNLGIREQVLVLTAATTGLRRSELAGLHWEDLDLVHGWISVNRSVDNNLENPCKTEASRKAVPLDLRIVPFFQRWKEVAHFKAPDDYVFAAGCNRAGGKRGKQPISLSVAFQYHIKPVADRLGVRPAVFGWHTFRRSFATFVVGNTKDVKAAQELLRHSTARLTLDLYAQALSENKVAASKAIAGSLLLPQPSLCTAVQSGQGTGEPVKLNAVNQSPSSSPA